MMSATIATAPTTDPTTMPAMAPPLSEFEVTDLVERVPL